MLTKADKILIVFILLSSILVLIGLQVYGFSSGTTYAVVHVDGKLHHKISLGSDGQNFQLKVPGSIGESVVEIKGDKVRMLYSPCPDKDCERQGWIDRPGQMIVCLPNRIVVKLVSHNKIDEIDMMSF
ncbi:MAG: NusG domain II-containing protein [Thermoanaerobacterales bacterium]|jgi:hypothetical protein|nr:NusG domain II-containing protein [Thermoanaerobacterales bacterium]